jgi:hypothetical protein
MPSADTDSRRWSELTEYKPLESLLGTERRALSSYSSAITLSIKFRGNRGNG